MAWDIKPLIGLGPLAFGMSPAAVAGASTQLGAVTARNTDQDGTINEYRRLEDPNFSYRADGLIFIATTWRVKDVLWNGVDVYAAPPLDILRTLETANGGAAQMFGVVVFDRLCLQLSGFYVFERSQPYDPHGEEQDDRGLTVWERVAHEDTMSKFAQHVHSVSFI